MSYKTDQFELRIRSDTQINRKNEKWAMECQRRRSKRFLLGNGTYLKLNAFVLQVLSVILCSVEEITTAAVGKECIEVHLFKRKKRIHREDTIHVQSNKEGSIGLENRLFIISQ